MDGMSVGDAVTESAKEETSWRDTRLKYLC